MVTSIARTLPLILSGFFVDFEKTKSKRGAPGSSFYLANDELKLTVR